MLTCFNLEKSITLNLLHHQPYFLRQAGNGNRADLL